MCENCLSPLERDTAPRAATSPIERYLSDLRRALGGNVLERRRTVAEVESHLWLLASEASAGGDVSPWEAEQTAITKMGSVESIVAGYELTQPPGGRGAHGDGW